MIVTGLFGGSVFAQTKVFIYRPKNGGEMHDMPRHFMSLTEMGGDDAPHLWGASRCSFLSAT